MSSTASTTYRTALYMRVSSKEQEIDGYGLESQYAALSHYTKANTQVQYITKKEWEFSDTHTGSDIMRTALQSLLTAIKKGEIDTVIVWKIDRLSRSMKHLVIIFEIFKKYNINFISVQENMNFNGAVGNFIFNVLSSVAELERSMIKVRTRAGKIASAEMGNYTGSNIPYGYKPIKNENGKGKRLAIIPKERDIVVQIFSWYIYDERGFLSIANMLTKKGIPLGAHARATSKSPDLWTEKRIEKIIKNPLYRGEFIANKTDESGFILPQEEWTVVSIPPCIDELVFTIAQRKLKERKSQRKRTGHIYLLSGKLVDISTPKHYKFSGFPRTKGGYSYRRKPHTDQYDIKHGVFEFPAEVAEEMVWQKIMLALGDPEKFIRLHLNQEYNKDKIDSIRKQLLQLRERKVNADLEHSRIERAYESGLYTLEKTEQKISELEQKEDKVIAEIHEKEQQLEQMALVDEEIASLKNAASEVNYNLETLSRKQKRLLIDVFVDRIEVDRKKMPSTSSKRTTWDRTLEVFFRFHPQPEQSDTPEARTQKAHHKGKKQALDSKNERTGGRGGRGWHSFTVRFEFKKQFLAPDIPGQSWRVQLQEI